MFVLAILFAVVAVGAIITFLASKKGSAAKGGAAIALGVGILGTLGFGFGSMTYTQDAGTAVVVKDVTGNIVGSSTTTGLHTKAPWDDTIEFNIRNQQVIFAEAATSANGGAQPDGPQITVQDADGVSSNVDIALRYSIEPKAVIEIYKQFQNADNFRTSFIEQDIRSVVRSVPNNYHTIDLLTKRSQVEAAIQTALENRWTSKNVGVSIDSVSLQEIRPPASVVEAYSAAQQAQIAVSTETNKLAAAKVAAQQQVVQAQAQAQANSLLEKSLTDNVLKQHALDTMAKLAASGNLVVTDSSGSTLLNVGKK